MAHRSGGPHVPNGARAPLSPILEGVDARTQRKSGPGGRKPFGPHPAPPPHVAIFDRQIYAVGTDPTLKEPPERR